MKRVSALWAMALTLWAVPSFAFLRSDESSLSVVKGMIAAKSEKVTHYSTHTVHEYAVMRGTIRAYVSPAGQIFAYTGQNQMGHPPLALLGDYLEEYRAAVKQAHRYGRRPLRLNTSHIKAGMSGPQGRLNWYLSLQSLPEGVTQDDIR